MSRVDWRALAGRILASLALALVLSAALVAPDHLMRLFSDHDRSLYTPAIFASVYVAALVVVLVRPMGFILSGLLVLGLFELVHFCYLAYFGGVIDANVIMQAFVEYADIAEAGIGVSSHLFYAPLIVIAPYSAAWLVVTRFAERRLSVPFLWVLVLAIIGIVPYKIVHDGDAVKYYPIDVYPSIANSYLTWSVLLANHIPELLAPALSAAGRPVYAPVTVIDRGPPGAMTIVLVMSESLTPRRMSLFGFERPTTPLLESLRADPDFIYKRGLAAGVGTLPSFYSFWNGIRDPRNVREFSRQATNLFRLARRHGFHTTLISAQGNNLLRGSGTRFVDDLVTQDSAGADYEALHDEMLLKHAGDIGLQDRNLIVLHQRSVHGPYVHNYRLHPELAIFPTAGLGYGDYQRNSYDNSVRYNDMIIYRLLEYFRGRVQGPLYFVVTSDHGQLLGDDATGLFGHGRLEPAMAEVPILFYLKNADPEVVRRAKAMRHPTHYQLTELVTRLLGFEIHDPNAVDGVYYVNGTGHYGRHGYLKVTIDPRDPETPEYEVVPAGQASTAGIRTSSD